jgi:hypothetical protein
MNQIMWKRVAVAFDDNHKGLSIASLDYMEVKIIYPTGASLECFYFYITGVYLKYVSVSEQLIAPDFE